MMQGNCYNCFFGRKLKDGRTTACLAQKGTAIRWYNSCELLTVKVDFIPSPLDGMEDEEIFEELEKRGYDLGFENKEAKKNDKI